MTETFASRAEAYTAALRRYAHDDSARRFDSSDAAFTVTFADGSMVAYRWLSA